MKFIKGVDGNGRVFIGDVATMQVVLYVLDGQSPGWCLELLEESINGVEIL